MEEFKSTVADIVADIEGFRVEIDPDRERADIILHRPPLNIVRMPQRDQFRVVFEELDRDERVRVIVVRAQGEHFSSGGEIPGFLERSPEHVSELAKNVAAPERCRKPVVAAIRGFCFGVAFELSLACDFRIMSDTAVVGLPEQRIGMIPGSGGSIRLLHMIGISRTKDMVMRSRRLKGSEALDWGIAVDCVPDADLEKATDALVDELRTFSPLAQRTAKGALNSAQHTTLAAGIEIEGNAYGRLRSSHDFREGVESFLAKRKPEFTGE
ncbi:MAG: enoyl-CoA hydratase/isomerase family protein [Gammaproteobacteria bacterium]|nr:enoyl-CoA hydratase/isomerase family protein [Gammaproteobacteria bacterium]